MAVDLLKLAELFEKNSGWCLDFLIIVVAVGLLATLVIISIAWTPARMTSRGDRSTVEQDTIPGIWLYCSWTCVERKTKNWKRSWQWRNWKSRNFLQFIKEREQEAGELSSSLDKISEWQTKQEGFADCRVFKIMIYFFSSPNTSSLIFDSPTGQHDLCGGSVEIHDKGHREG
jgi:hypothetical protein